VFLCAWRGQDEVRAVPVAASLNRRNLEPLTHRHADRPGRVHTQPSGGYTLVLGHNLSMVGGGGGSPADEQLVARFSGRLDDRVGRFLGRLHADQWVWDQQLEAILGYPLGGGSASLQTLLQHVADDEQQLVADAFRAAEEHGDPVMVSCRLQAADGSAPVRIGVTDSSVFDATGAELTAATSGGSS